MSILTKTTQDLYLDFLATLESAVNQDSPLNDKAFLRVFSGDQAMLVKSLIKFGQKNALQNLASTAYGDGLERIALEYNVPRKAAQETILNIALPAGDGIVIPETVIFTGDSNGAVYYPDAPATGSGGAALLTVSAEIPGADGNLNDGETLSMDRQIAGAETTATIISTEQLGVNEEEETLWQRRVQQAVRKKAGGENSDDIRTWAEATPGVAAAFPYTGRPYGDPTPTAPPDRTIYIQATEDIDPDGIAPPALLDTVKDNLLTDPETGRSRETLGMTDEFLFVESIRITNIYTEIRGLTTPSGQETQVKTAIEAATAAYYKNLRPFIQGLDFEGNRQDKITDLTVSDTIEDVLKANNSSARAAAFALIPSVFLGEYTLLPGELTKQPAGGVSYG